jgi:hypothetical protein
METRSSKVPARVRVAPEPLFERPAPRVEWSPAGMGWETGGWPVEGNGADRIVIAIPLGFDRGADHETELTEAGAR